MWILLHDDLADPDSDDPVSRESTRVTAAAVAGGQTSIDPKVIEPWLGPNVLKHNMINMAVGEPDFQAPRLARARLERGAYRGQLDAAAHEGHGEACAQARAERGVAVGLGSAQAVVDVNGEQARAAFDASPARIIMVGHTHLAGAWRLGDDGRLDGGLVRGEETLSLEGGRWLINPGSVGQPRDLDPRASWVILDLEALTLRFRRTPYDVPGAQNAIQAAGLPAELGARLAEGR